MSVFAEVGQHSVTVPRIDFMSIYLDPFFLDKLTKQTIS